MEVLLVVLIAAMLILIGAPMFTSHGHPRWVQDASNIRYALISMMAYAADHHEALPLHIQLAGEYTDYDDFLFSPYDHKESVLFDETIKPGWYQYGSYWFLSVEGLTYDTGDSAASIMLVYRTPRPEHESYVVGFMGGHVESLSSEEFAERMKQQEGLIQQPEDAGTEP